MKKIITLIISLFLIFTFTNSSAEAYRKWHSNGSGYSEHVPTAHYVRIVGHGSGNYYAFACQGNRAKTKAISRGQGYWLYGTFYGERCL